jgi:cytoskeleton protein RodZ
MPAFGENLRREREMRGVSLEEISSATKISLRLLEAIEREDFAKLPGGIFSRSFIRTYARYLGLDEERVVADFQLAAQPQTDFDLHRMAAGNASAGRPGGRTPLIATLVAVALLAGGYALFRYSRRAAEAPPPPPPAAEVTPPSAAQPPAPVPPSSGNGTAVPGANPPAGRVTPPLPSGTSAAPSGAANPSASPVAGGNPGITSNPQTGNPPATKLGADTDLVLQVAVTERVWMAVDADGKTVFQRMLNPDEVQTLKAHRSFDVTTANAQAVILTLNGETLKPLGRHGEVKSVHLTREDVKKPSP